MAHSSGWSKPVWYLLATIRIWNSSVPNATGRVRPRRPGFRLVSVNGGSALAKVTPSTVIEPENATRVPML